ncbi:hypothetical protein HZS_5919 [Henneguya salminicola]|nr:hypothetical protein HZS_5919 [Henneguya salminicola]
MVSYTILIHEINFINMIVIVYLCLNIYCLSLKGKIKITLHTRSRYEPYNFFDKIEIQNISFRPNSVSD